MSRGYDEIAAGEVVTHDYMNDAWLKAGIRYFASPAARNAAITSPEEGMHAYLADSDSLTRYDGSAWEAAAFQYLRINSAGTVYGPFRQINMIAGTSITLSAAGDAGNDEVDVTINATTSIHVEAKDAGTGTTGQTVTWTQAFTATPVVTVSPLGTNSGNAIIAYVESRSTTGASVGHKQHDNTATGVITKMVIATEAT